jgi:hypothetical protein
MYSSYSVSALSDWPSNNSGITKGASEIVVRVPEKAPCAIFKA